MLLFHRFSNQSDRRFLILRSDSFVPTVKPPDGNLTILLATSVVSTASGSQTILYRLTERPKGQLNVEAELQEIAPEDERSMLCAACESLWISPYGRIHRIASYDLPDGATIEDINQIYMDIYNDLKPVMDAVDAARGHDDADHEGDIGE